MNKRIDVTYDLMFGMDIHMGRASKEDTELFNGHPQEVLNNNLYFSTGEQLDSLGRLYNVHRIVESDVTYRLRIIEEFNNVNKQLMKELGDKT